MHVGSLVREAREKHGMTQAELGAELGITRQAVSKLERRATVRRDQLLAIATCLGLSPAQIGMEQPATALAPHTIDLTLRGSIGEEGMMVRRLDDDQLRIRLDLAGLEAFRVETADLAPRLVRGDVVLVSPDEITRPENHIGALVLAQLEDGRELLRLLASSSRPGHFQLRTYRDEAAPLDIAGLASLRPVALVLLARALGTAPTAPA